MTTTATATNKPWYVIRCTGQEFATCYDWGEWCKAHPDGFAMEHEGWMWNGASICINPHEPVNYQQGQSCYEYSFSVHTAKSPCGLWSYGVSYNCGITGGGFGAEFIPSPYQKGYDTEKAAIVAALDYMIINISAEIDRINDENKRGVLPYPGKPSTNLDKAKKLLQALKQEKERYAPSQPSLFNFLD